MSLRGLANLVVEVQALRSEVHSGMYGGPAPDAMAALIRMLATFRDERGNTTIAGLDNTQTWSGVAYPPERFRSGATVLDGVSGSATAPSPTWYGLGPWSPSSASTASSPRLATAIQPRARARLNLRVPPGMDPAKAHNALAAHLKAAAPWGVRVTVDSESGRPGESHPRAPTDPRMSVSAHGALLTRSSRCWSSIASA